MNSYSKELCHWAFGEKKKNHKYIDRIRDTLHDTWKYIYEDKKNAAAKNKQAVKNFADNWRDGADAIKSKVKSTFSRSGKASLNSAKMKYRAAIVIPYDDIRDINDITAPDIKKKIAEIEAEKKKKAERKQKIEDVIDEAKTFVNKILKTVGINYQLPTKKSKYDNIKIGQKYARNYNDINVPDYVKTPPREVVNKELMDDGRLVVFRDKKQKDEWERIKKYQDNEPEFMKNVKNIEPNVNGELPSRSQNMERTNPEYTNNYDATTNCWHCSTAYDLRKRGYDVSALPIESDFGVSDITKFYKVSFEDSTGDQKEYRFETTRTIAGNKTQKDVQSAIDWYAMERKKEDKWAKYYHEDYVEYSDTGNKVVLQKDIHGSNDSMYAIHPVLAVSSYIEANPSASASECIKNNAQFGECMAKNLTKRIDRFPENSWGRISVQWKDGGGHSFQWEKDSNGKLTFVDAQTNQTVNIQEYMSDASPFYPVSVMRTDNLELTEKVLDYVTNNNGKVNKRKDEGG